MTNLRDILFNSQQLNLKWNYKSEAQFLHKNIHEH